MEKTEKKGISARTGIIIGILLFVGFITMVILLEQHQLNERREFCVTNGFEDTQTTKNNYFCVKDNWAVPIIYRGETWFVADTIINTEEKQ